MWVKKLNYGFIVTLNTGIFLIFELYILSDNNIIILALPRSLQGWIQRECSSVVTPLFGCAIHAQWALNSLPGQCGWSHHFHKFPESRGWVLLGVAHLPSLFMGSCKRNLYWQGGEVIAHCAHTAQPKGVLAVSPYPYPKSVVGCFCILYLCNTSVFQNNLEKVFLKKVKVSDK